MDGGTPDPETAPSKSAVRAAKSTLDPAPKGALPAPESLSPTQPDKALTPQLPALRADEKQQPDPDSLKEAVRSITTRDGDIPVTASPKAQIRLSGSADPARSAELQQHALGEITAAAAAGQTAVEQLRGEDLLKRASVDSSYAVALSAYTPTYTTKQVPEQQQYLGLGLPPAVLAQFDTLNQPQMQASLQGARAAMDAAANQRDQRREQELGGARGKADEASVQAAQRQEELLAKSKAQLQGERDKTKQQYQNEQQKFDAQAKAKLAQTDQRIKQRVAQDQQRIDSEYKRTEESATKEVQEGERKAEEEKRKAEEAERNQTWWQRLVGFFVDLLRSIVKLIVQIFDAIRQVVTTLLDKVKELASALIDAACQFVQSLIAGLGELLKAAVDVLLGAVFPELAKALQSLIDRAVEATNRAVQNLSEELKRKVSALTDGLKGALDVILSTFDLATNAALSLVYAVMTGDWKGMLRQVLVAVLQLAEVDAATFAAIMAKAEAALDLILRQPFQFIGNLIKALVDGFSLFAKNFVTHLRSGLVGWLTGMVSTTGLALPPTLDAAGIFSLVVQLLGLTKENLRQLLIKQLGPQKVHLVERVWAEVETLLVGGWAALWERVQGYLGNLYEELLSGVTSWLTQEVVNAAIAKIATHFVPVAGLVEAISTVGQIATFLREQMSQLAQLLVTVVSGLYEVATGNTGAISAGIENTLAGLLGVAINLLARLLGIADLGTRVREILQGLQGKVWGAIDKFVTSLAASLSGIGEPKEGTERNDKQEPKLGESEDGIGDVEYEDGLPLIRFTMQDEERRLSVNQSKKVDISFPQLALAEWVTTEKRSNAEKTQRTPSDDILSEVQNDMFAFESDLIKENPAKGNSSFVNKKLITAQSVVNAKYETHSRQPAVVLSNTSKAKLTQLANRLMMYDSTSRRGVIFDPTKPSFPFLLHLDEYCEIRADIRVPLVDSPTKYCATTSRLDAGNHNIGVKWELIRLQKTKNTFGSTEKAEHDARADLTSSTSDNPLIVKYPDGGKYEFQATIVVSPMPGAHGRKISKTITTNFVQDVVNPYTWEHWNINQIARSTKDCKDKLLWDKDLNDKIWAIGNKYPIIFDKNDFRWALFESNHPEYSSAFHNNLVVFTKNIDNVRDRVEKVQKYKYVFQKAITQYDVDKCVLVGNVFLEMNRDNEFLHFGGAADTFLANIGKNNASLGLGQIQVGTAGKALGYDTTNWGDFHRGKTIESLNNDKQNILIAAKICKDLSTAFRSCAASRGLRLSAAPGSSWKDEERLYVAAAYRFDTSTAPDNIVKMYKSITSPPADNERSAHAKITISIGQEVVNFLNL